MVWGWLEESGDKATFAQERDKTRELSQCLSNTVIPTMSLWPPLSVILRWELQSKQTNPQIANHFGSSLQNQISSQMSSCYCSRVSRQHSSEGRKGRSHESPVHQDRDPLKQLELHMTLFTHSSTANSRKGCPLV